MSDAIFFSRLMNRIVLGIDGCSNGWCCVRIETLKCVSAKVFPTITRLWEENQDACLALIDMPIGLKSGNQSSRRCDKEARQILTKIRSSSIFPTPIRDILNIPIYQKANKQSKILTGKGISKQTWNIMPKIIELDQFLKKNRPLLDVFHESHPEVCFTILNDNIPLKYNKKTPGGAKERLSIIKDNWFDKKIPFKLIRDTLNKQKIKKDDLIDAIILGLVASRGKNSIKFLPKNFNLDSEGFPMRITIPRLTKNMN